jgi:hypothetical protein
MTELRDARFKKALDAAPDADARPMPSVAALIRAAARKALAQPLARTAPSAWWQHLWRSSGSPQAPWNAAFATLLLGVLVTLLWLQEPIPDARPMAPTTTTSTAEGPRLPAAAVASTGAAAPADSAPAAKVLSRAQPQYAAPAAAVAESAVSPVAAPSADAAPLVPARMAAAPMAAMPVPSAALGADGEDVPAWTALTLQLGGRRASVERAQGQALYARLQRQLGLLTSAAAAASAPAAIPANEPMLRITVLQQDQTLAVFTLWENTLLWQRSGRVAVLGAIDAADAQALVSLAQQAL